MYDFILQLVFMGSLAAIVYIMALSIPRIDFSPAEEHPVKKLIASIPLKKIDESLVLYKDRILRKLRIVILKAENFISKLLHKGKDNPTLKP